MQQAMRPKERSATLKTRTATLHASGNDVISQRPNVTAPIFVKMCAMNVLKAMQSGTSRTAAVPGPYSSLRGLRGGWITPAFPVRAGLKDMGR